MNVWSRRGLTLVLFSWGLGGCGGGGGGKAPSDGGRDGSSDHPVVPPGLDGGRTDAALDGPDGSSPRPQTYALTVTAVDTTFDTEDHFIAAVEMQLSGEPFAEAMGRDLSGYTRDYACQDAICSPSMYVDPASTDGGSVVDLAGYSSGIESYEYSKQPMNNIAFESGAGTSLLFGPVINPTGATGTDALVLAQTWFEHMASESNAGGKYRPARRRRQSARLAGAVARAAAVLLVESGHRADQPRRLLAVVRRQSGEERRAALRRLRVRLHDAEFPEPRRAGDEDHRPGIVRMDRLERGALDAQLPADHARR